MSDEPTVGPSLDQAIFAAMGYTQWLDYHTWREGESDGRGFSTLGLPRVSTDPGAAFTWAVAWLVRADLYPVIERASCGDHWTCYVEDEDHDEIRASGRGATPAEAVARCALAWAAARGEG